ncbi:MAG: hypothetical protein IPL53_24995 [Ignavibacteria bacterium]|nr:hypothetical protein [Ignavibacteria bacterium]
MTGYTALMQQNEQSAKDKRRRLKEVLETYVALQWKNSSVLWRWCVEYV